MKKILAVVLAVLMFASVPAVYAVLDAETSGCDICGADAGTYQEGEWMTFDAVDADNHLVTVWVYERCNNCGTPLYSSFVTDSLEGHRMENGTCTDCGYTE